MGENKLGLKQYIESSFQQGVIEPLMLATGRNLLRRLPEKNPQFDKAEHRYLGFWGANSVVDAFKDVPELTQDPLNTLVISDMDGPFVKLRPSIKSRGLTKLPDVRLFNIDEDQVFALEDSTTPNVYASNRSIHFPETPQLVEEMQRLGVRKDTIFLYQDKEFGLFRDQAEFDRMTTLINKLSPKQLFLIFDMYNWPITLMQDLTGTSGHYLKDILHNLDIVQQQNIGIGMVGVTPLLKDTIFVPFVKS